MRDRHVVEHRPSAFLRSGHALRQARGRPAVREREERQRREEPRRRSLELRNQLELQRRGFDAVTGMRLHGAQRLLLERCVTRVVHEHRLQCRRVAGGWRAPEEGHRRRRRIGGELDAGRQRNVDAHGCVLGDPRRALNAVVEAVVAEQRVGGVPCQPPLCFPGRERAGADAVARYAGPAVALKCLLVEQAPPLLESLRQACEPGRGREERRDRSRR